MFSGYRRAPVKISTGASGVAAGTQAVTAPGAFAFKPRENRNFGATTRLNYVTFWSSGIALRVSLTMKDLSLPSESKITLPKMLATGWLLVKMTRGSERVNVLLLKYLATTLSSRNFRVNLMTYNSCEEHQCMNFHQNIYGEMKSLCPQHSA